MDKNIIATELLKGQGLGNQLFCYITTRCLAMEKGYDFSILNSDLLEKNIKDFMNLDYGVECEKPELEVYDEKEDRIFMDNSFHDIEHGCYIGGADKHLLELDESTCVQGNMQAPEYFAKYKNEIKEWLKVNPECDNMENSKDNLCVINIRGGEYAGDPALFLRRKYWKDAIRYMKGINPDMQFMVVTDDKEAAHRILPEVEAYHGDLAFDYTTIKNAKYLILSNSTFAFFPAFTSETAKVIIAPKYWARHNVSDGYWASEQNIYDEFLYMDRTGKTFTANECREELEEYKKSSERYKKLNQKMSDQEEVKARKHASQMIKKDLCIRAVRSMMRRISRK